MEKVDLKNIDNYSAIFDNNEVRSSIVLTHTGKDNMVSKYHMGYEPLEEDNAAKKWIEALGGELEVAKATAEFQKQEDKARGRHDLYMWLVHTMPELFDGDPNETANWFRAVAEAKARVRTFENINAWLDSMDKMPRWFKNPDETVDRYYKFWDENTQNKDFLDNIEAIKQWYYGDRKAKPPKTIVKIKEIEVRVEKEFDLFKLFEMDYQPDEETLFRLKIGIFEDPRVKACKDRKLKTALRKAADVHEVMARYWQIKEATKDQVEESAS